MENPAGLPTDATRATTAAASDIGIGAGEVQECMNDDHRVDKGGKVHFLQSRKNDLPADQYFLLKQMCGPVSNCGLDYGE